MLWVSLSCLSVGISLLTRWYAHVSWYAVLVWIGRDWRWIGLASVVAALAASLIPMRALRVRAQNFRRETQMSAALSYAAIPTVVLVVAILGAATLWFLWSQIGLSSNRRQLSSLRQPSTINNGQHR
jgi:hypothetical protein